uniref:Glycosyltransferase n=1 Tax=Davidia involucrata TaxID=16924 RepID=A0A5B7BAS6_DAVIN
MTTTRHIGVLAFPFGTHAAPLLTLVRRLAAAAPDLRFSFFSTEKSNASIFWRRNGDRFFDNIKPYNVWDGLPEGYVFSGNVIELVEFWLKATPDNVKKGIAEAVAHTGVRISCLLTDAFLWFAGGLADEMGIPWVQFWTSGAFSLSVHMYTDVIRSTLQGTNGKTENANQTLKFIPGMSAIHIGDLPDGVLSGNLETPFARMLHSMGLKVPQATAVVINSFEELDPTITNDLKSKLQKVLSVGPSNLSLPPPSNSDDSACLPWLDKHKNASSVAYISFGTITTPPPNELAALAEALEASAVPFLWSLKDNSRHLLPEGFLERTSRFGKVVSWAPQLQVLAHTSIGVFVTHCGWNSILESITGGVPMICRPFFGDQKLNSRKVEDIWGIGVIVAGGVFTKGGTIKALDLLLLNEKGKKMRENIGVLKGNAMKAVGLNGSSTQNFKTLLEVVKTNYKG